MLDRISKVAAASLVLYAVPLLVHAQELGPLVRLVRSVGTLLNVLIPVLIAAALCAFFYGLVMYIWGAAGGQSKADSQKVMIAGLVSLFIMVSVWGIIRLAQNALNIGPDQISNTPSVPSR